MKYSKKVLLSAVFLLDMLHPVIPKINFKDRLEPFLERTNFSVKAAEALLRSELLRLIDVNDSLEMSFKRIPNGLNSETVYAVSDQKGKLLYVLKELKPSKKTIECQRLAQIQDGFIGQLNGLAVHGHEFFAPEIQPYLHKFPHICSVLYFIEFDDALKNSHTVELLEAAQGLVMEQHLENPLITPEIFARQCENIGMAAALFHQATMSEKDRSQIIKSSPLEWVSYIHGDFHVRNIFYDNATDLVSLIDNEKTRQSYSFKDLKTFINSLVRRVASQRATPEKVVAGLKAFTQGYRSCYPPEAWRGLTHACYYHSIESLFVPRTHGKKDYMTQGKISDLINTALAKRDLDDETKRAIRMLVDLVKHEKLLEEAFVERRGAVASQPRHDRQSMHRRR